MGPNEAHPDFPEYKRKWDELWEQMNRELDDLDSVPWEKREGGKMGRIHKKYGQKIKALQREYGHLYESDVEN